MKTDPDDLRWLTAACSLAERARPLSRPNPAVGAIIIKDGLVVGRGWTQTGGRPHAEAAALAEAGKAARGATVYVTLEPCAHQSNRGPSCASLLVEAGVRRVVVGIIDPDPRTSGQGIERLRSAGIAADCMNDSASAASLAGFLSQKTASRPFVTLKIATSLDGCIALPSGESQWITGAPARAHAHRERARNDAILVGGATLRIDRPLLDVRLPGLESRSPRRLVLTRKTAPEGWQTLSDPAEISQLTDVQYLLVEGGAQAAAAFIQADLVDRLLIYRAPILVGSGRASLGDIGLTSLAAAHNRWQLADQRRFGIDTLEILERTR